MTAMGNTLQGSTHHNVKNVGYTKYAYTESFQYECACVVGPGSGVGDTDRQGYHSHHIVLTMKL